MNVRGCAVVVFLSLVAGCQQATPPVLPTEARDDDACGYARRPLAEVEGAFGRYGRPEGQDGALDAYIAARQRDSRRASDVAAAIDAEALADDANVIKAANALGLLARCRQDQVNATAAGLQRRTTSPEAGRAQYQRLAAALDADARTMAAIVAQAQARSRLYVRARAAVLGDPDPDPDGRPAMRGGNFIAKNAANVRAQPSITAPVVGRLAPGQPIVVTGESPDGKWLVVQNRNATAYISRSLLAPAPGSSPAELRRRAPGRNAAETFVASTRDAAEQLGRFRAIAREVEGRAAAGTPTS